MTTTIYIGYYLLQLNLFNSETSEEPCGDHFPVAYGTTETFVFRVKQSISDVKFDAAEPIKWYDEESNVIPQPSNITAPVLTEGDRVMTFQDEDLTTTEVRHRFALQMLVNGQLTPLGLDPSSSSARLDPVDPTIIDQGDQGSGGGIERT